MDLFTVMLLIACFFVFGGMLFIIENFWTIVAYIVGIIVVLTLLVKLRNKL